MTNPVPIRVLHILEATLGGTRRYIENIAEAMGSQPFHFGLVYSTRRCDEQFNYFLRRAQEYGWELYEVPMVRSLHPIYDMRDVKLITSIIRLFHPDIVHCHSAKAGGLGRLAVLAVSSSRPKAIYTPNALPVHLGFHYGLLERLLAKITDRFVAISESERQEIIAVCQVSPAKVSVVWPVIDSQYFLPVDRKQARRIIGVSEKSKLIVGIGRLSYQKDPFTFVKIIEVLHKTLPDIRGIWVGDGELRDQVQRLIVKRGLEEVISISGWTTDVRPFIASADVVLMPSRYESFGYVAAEALAMERPVVATRVTGLVDIIPNTDLLFKPGDWATGSRIVAHLLQYPDKAGLIGQRGREYVKERFTLVSMRGKLTNAYLSSLA